MLTYIDFVPDVIHCNDWQSALCCVYLKDVYSRFTFYSRIKTLFTIHNIQYQGIFARDTLWNIDLNDGYYTNGTFEFFTNISYLKAGLVYAHAISTVSETYAGEIQTPSYGYGLHGLLYERRSDVHGIINGIDYDVFNPETDKYIEKKFNIDTLDDKKVNKSALQRKLGLDERDVPLIAIISRLADQKGFDLISIALEELISMDVQLAILGTGDGRYEHMFKHAAYRCPNKISANVYFDEALAAQIYAGADMFLMPSLFEPCGLSQLIAMRYGTIPIVRNTGGLADSVRPYIMNDKEATGFVFDNYDAHGMMWGVRSAIHTYYDAPAWRTLQLNAMKADFSWNKSARQYIELYTKLTKSI
jgi:starch synthase